jgi:predicted amidohydrolase
VATVAWTSTPLKTYGDNVVVASWTPLTNADADGQAFEMPGWADKSVHVFGSFGGATIAIQGSNEVVPTNWSTLREASGAPATDQLSFTALDIKQVLEVTRWIRPLLTGGAASSVTVLLLIRRG